jgi:hypothetical protein
MIEQSVAGNTSPIPVVPLAENPLFDDWLAAVEEHRINRDAEERAAEGDAEPVQASHSNQRRAGSVSDRSA